ncbi:hypothetical protein LTR32_003751 [Rachicladosporium monterosium]|uniref:Uncharacterized protein n=1 Tax=Rachicladosporium monterosium TaxID=1507873 RepID=A0ABR0L6M2_9PEZI|nr:hypothetical protein LTR32_003751 [Rachicladosporium monterosium]
MCVIERRTYQHSSGREEIHERVRRCRHAVGTSICADADTRVVEQATLVDRRPEVDRVDPQALLVTEGFNGRHNVYREVDTRSGRRRSVRRSNTTPSPFASSSSRSSASYASPEAPSPPRAAPFVPLSADTGPTRTLRADGTAVYDRPPSLDFPRALDNERRTRLVEPAEIRRSPASSVMSEVDEADTVIRVPRRPSISVNTARLSPATSSPTTSSPGLSQLPRLGHSRHDSARDVPAYRSQRESYEDRQRRWLLEDEQQAQLERDRLAETTRRQQAREDSSRDRHRAEAIATLEGQVQPQRNMQSQLRRSQTLLDAELAQMARERAETATRQTYAGDRLQRDADLARLEQSRDGPRTHHNVSPLSARSPPYSVAIHQHPDTRLDDTLEERGEAVIAREQARAQREAAGPSSSRRPQQASRRLSYSTGDLTIDGPRSMEVEVDLDDDEVSERLESRASRKERRAAERAAQRSRFWK